MPSKTRSNKKSANRKTRKAERKVRNNKTAKRMNSSRKSLSVSDIRSRFKEMDSHMREFIRRNNLNNPRELGKQVSRQWAGLFNKQLSGSAANSLAKHYLNIHGRRAARGGSAPLDYVMRPGLPGVAAYATFPTEAGADPKAVGHLDVYYNNALGRSCGTENTTAHVPKDMGSNQVPAAPAAPPAPVKGGARRRRTTTRKRGGDFMLAMQTRPYVAENPSVPFQRMTESWYGVAPYGTDSSEHSRGVGDLRLVSNGMLPINPDKISIVDKDITRMANPSPYPAVK